MADVLIVGAGPTGLALAIQLTRYGIPVRIIDLLAQPMRESRAVGIHARSLEFFERMDVVTPFLERGLRYREVFVHSDRGPMVHQKLGERAGSYNYLLALAQNETESILSGRLSSLGKAVERGVRLVHLEQDASKVRAHMRGPEGETAVDYAYVIGCDGANSTVRFLLDAAFAGESVSESFALADVRIDADFPRDAVSMHLTSGHLVALFPLPNELVRVIVEREGGFEMLPTLDDFRSALYLSGIQARSYGEPVWISQLTTSQRRVASSVKGRVFLAGDAAHTFSPLGAQGLNAGLQDVENLAWKLALTYRFGALETVLASYATEREAVAERLVRKIRTPRDRIAAIDEFDVGYERSPIVVRPGRTPDPHPGARAPDGGLVRVADGVQTSIFSLCATLRHLLLVFTYRRDQFVHELLLEIQRHAEIVEVQIVTRDASVGGAQLLDPAGSVFRTYGAQGEPQYVLIRPDGYIAARGALRDYRGVLAYLDVTFGLRNPQAT